MNPAADHITQNLDHIRERIRQAATRAGRNPETIRLIAVSKHMPASALRLAMSAGQACFGENYLQEALEKQLELASSSAEWHFIGHLQSNKARHAAGRFSWLHTLDSLKLASRLSAAMSDDDPVLNVLLQVNIADDPDKAGIPGTSVLQFAESLLQADLHGIRLRGLMTIGRANATDDSRRAEFDAMRRLSERCSQQLGAEFFSELSMGMSDDFESAIAAGSTMVRIGSAIFGPRPVSDQTLAG